MNIKNNNIIKEVELAELHNGDVFKLTDSPNYYIKTSDYYSDVTIVNLENGEVLEYPAYIVVTKVNAELVINE